MMDYTEEVLLEVVQIDGGYIQTIDEPTEEMMLIAVKQDGKNIEFIENQPEYVKLEAVKQTGIAIQYILNPTEEMKLEAVKQDGKALEYIEDPTIEQISIALAHSIHNIRYINDDFGLYNMNIIRNRWGTYVGKLITCEFEGKKLVLAGCYNSDNYQDFSDKLSTKILEYPKRFREVDVENVLKEIELFFE